MLFRKSIASLLDSHGTRNDIFRVANTLLYEEVIVMTDVEMVIAAEEIIKSIDLSNVVVID